MAPEPSWEADPLAVGLRPACAEDETFLYQLFSLSGMAELPLPEPQKQFMLRMQFNAQNASYQAAYPNSRHSIVIRDGEPVGRIWVASSDAGLELVDIALLPAARQSGIGSRLIRQLQDEAAGLGKPLRCSVFRFNAAACRFYQRHGFRVTSEDELQHHLEWS